MLQGAAKNITLWLISQQLTLSQKRATFLLNSFFYCNFCKNCAPPPNKYFKIEATFTTWILNCDKTHQLDRRKMLQKYFIKSREMGKVSFFSRTLYIYGVIYYYAVIFIKVFLSFFLLKGRIPSLYWIESFDGWMDGWDRHRSFSASKKRRDRFDEGEMDRSIDPTSTGRLDKRGPIYIVLSGTHYFFPRPTDRPSLLSQDAQRHEPLKLARLCPKWCQTAAKFGRNRRGGDFSIPSHVTYDAILSDVMFLGPPEPDMRHLPFYQWQQSDTSTSLVTSEKRNNRLRWATKARIYTCVCLCVCAQHGVVLLYEAGGTFFLVGLMDDFVMREKTLFFPMDPPTQPAKLFSLFLPNSNRAV